MNVNKININQSELTYDILSDAGYLYVGIATPDTNPGTIDASVFYFANQVGIYTNFDNIEVSKGESAILKFDGGAWTKNVFKPMTSFDSVFNADGNTLTDVIAEEKAAIIGTDRIADYAVTADKLAKDVNITSNIIASWKASKSDKVRSDLNVPLKAWDEITIEFLNMSYEGLKTDDDYTLASISFDGISNVLYPSFRNRNQFFRVVVNKNTILNSVKVYVHTEKCDDISADVVVRLNNQFITTIKDGEVTTYKIDDSAVTNDKIADGAVSAAKLAKDVNITSNIIASWKSNKNNWMYNLNYDVKAGDEITIEFLNKEAIGLKGEDTTICSIAISNIDGAYEYVSYPNFAIRNNVYKFTIDKDTTLKNIYVNLNPERADDFSADVVVWLNNQFAINTNTNKRFDVIESNINNNLSDKKYSYVDPSIFLANKIPVVIGNRLELFKFGMTKYLFDYYDLAVKGENIKGRFKENGYYYDAKEVDTEFTAEFMLISDDRSKAGSVTTTIIPCQKGLSPSTIKNILCIGDSWTNINKWVQEFKRRLCNIDGTPLGDGL